MCDIWQLSDVVLCTSSIMHMCTISMDRYSAIRHPLRCHAGNKSSIVFGTKIAAVWLVSFIIGSPLIGLGALRPSQILSDERQCAIFNSYYLVYGSLAAFFGPLGIMLAAFSLTIRLLNRQSKQLSDSPGGGMRRCTSRDRKTPNPKPNCEKSIVKTKAVDGGCSTQSPTTSARQTYREPSNANLSIVDERNPSNGGGPNNDCIVSTGNGERVDLTPDGHAESRQKSDEVDCRGRSQVEEFNAEKIARAQWINSDNKHLANTSKCSNNHKNEETGGASEMQDITLNRLPTRPMDECSSSYHDHVVMETSRSLDDVRLQVNTGDVSYGRRHTPAPSGGPKKQLCLAMKRGRVREANVNNKYNQVSWTQLKNMSKSPSLPGAIFSHRKHCDERSSLLTYQDSPDDVIEHLASPFMMVVPDKDLSIQSCVINRAAIKCSPLKPSLSCHVMISRDQMSVRKSETVPALSDIKQQEASQACDCVVEPATLDSTKSAVPAISCEGSRQPGGLDDFIDGRKVAAVSTVDNASNAPPPPPSSTTPVSFKSLVKKHGTTFKMAGILETSREDRKTKVLNSVNTERKAVKVLGIMFAIFCTCWAPFFTANLAMGICQSCHIDQSLFKVRQNIQAEIRFRANIMNEYRNAPRTNDEMGII